MFSIDIRGTVYTARTLAGISAAYCKARDESGEGASTFPAPIVQSGAFNVARISYNGRVWPTGASWETAVPFYCPAADPVPAMLAALQKCRVEMEMLRRQYEAEGKGEEWVTRQTYLIGECDAAITDAKSART